MLWDNEAILPLSDNRGVKVRLPAHSSAFDLQYTVTTTKHPLYLMVCGAFVYNRLADLVILPQRQTVDSRLYLYILNENLAEYFPATGAKILQQDGALCSTTKLSKTDPVV